MMSKSLTWMFTLKMWMMNNNTMVKIFMFLLLCVVLVVKADPDGGDIFSGQRSSHAGRNSPRAKQQQQHQGSNPPFYKGSGCQSCTSGFSEQKDVQELLSRIVTDQLSTSISYMFTSKQFASQNEERRGAAQMLEDMSDENWERAIGLIKEVLERGGQMNSPLSLSGEGLMKTDASNEGENYANTMTGILDMAKYLADRYNQCYMKAAQAPDAQFAYYCMDQMRKSTQSVPKLVGTINEMKKMKSSGVGVESVDLSL